MNLKRYSDFETSTEVKSEISSPYVEIKSAEPLTEDVLLTPKDSNLAIEILEENIIKFNTGDIKDILETIKNKYSTTDYYFRKKDNQLHVVKYNEKLNLNINEFVNTLLKYYSTNLESKKIIEGIKVKGNQNFSIVENMKSNYSNKFVDDLTKLLSKKNKTN